MVARLKRSAKEKYKILAVFSAVTSVFLLSYALTSIPIELISAIISSLLTLTLAVLYFRQTGIQNQQTELMENQGELMEADHRPLIDIEYLLPQSVSPVGPSKNSIIVGLMNVGNGVAIDPQLYTSIEHDEENIEIQSARFPLIRWSESQSLEGQGFDKLSSALPPNAASKLYETTLQIGIDNDGETESLDFPFALKRLYESGIEEIELEVGIEVKDVTDEWHSFELMKFETNIPHVITGPYAMEPDDDPQLTNAKEELSFTRVFRYGVTERGTSLVEETGEPTPWTNKTTEISIRAIEAAVSDIGDTEEEFIDFLNDNT